MTAAPTCVALHADASHRSGTGHVVRCLSPAAALRDAGAQPCLASRRLGIDAAVLAARAGIKLVELAATTPGLETADPVTHAAWTSVDWERDADETAQSLAERRCDCVMDEYYVFDAPWQRRGAAALGAHSYYDESRLLRAYDEVIAVVAKSLKKGDVRAALRCEPQQPTFKVR